MGRFSGLGDFVSDFISPIQARDNQWRIYMRAEVIRVKRGKHVCHVKKTRGDSPGGAVVKNLPANAGNTGSSPGPGRSHVPRSS